MHYDPQIAIMTGIEFDHADIFNDIDHIKSAFSSFVDKIQDTAHIVAFDGSKHLVDVLSARQLSVENYGESSDWYFSNHVQAGNETAFTVNGPQIKFDVQTRMVGRHNLYNSLACIASATRLGISQEHIKKALKTFSGIKRRQEIRGIRNRITVMDDFAHHPTAVKETIKAVKPFYRDGRVIAVFEPRTNTSMRTFFQNDYPHSFIEADIVCICDPAVKKMIPDQEKFSTKQLVADIQKLGVKALCFESSQAVIEGLVPMLKPGDLVLVMSNGGFDNIHARLLEKI